MKVGMGGLATGVPLRSTTVSRHVDVRLAVCTRCKHRCVRHTLGRPPRFMALAQDKTIVPLVSQPVNDDVLHGGHLDFGQDVTFGIGRPAPGGWSVADDEPTLRAHMRSLLVEFAVADPDGKAARLVDAFLRKNDEVTVFTDSDLDRATAAHENFVDFAEMTLAAPGSRSSGGGGHGVRIHQALKAAGWDIDRAKPITDLGVPAFNKGSKFLRTRDFDNGLGLMINGWQYVLVYCERYEYSSCLRRYEIDLKFVLYDVFGLDDDDLAEYGARNSWLRLDRAQVGITAWWQLQHQYGYAPLLTRAVARKTFVVSTKGG